MKGMTAKEYAAYLDSTEIGHCSECERSTWTAKEIGRKCGLRQPNREKCLGIFVAKTNKEEKMSETLNLDLKKELTGVFNE
jgi:hypothetical protein